MVDKPTLTFYTNIPTPNSLDFFDELSKRFEFKVVYYSNSESNRSWNFEIKHPFTYILLKNNFIAKIIQRWVVDFHFSWDIFRTTMSDSSKYVIISGAYWIPNTLVAIIVNKIRRKKIAFFSEPLYENNSRIKFIIKYLFLRPVSLFADAIFCTGIKSIESFNYYKVSIRKLIVTYNINTNNYDNLDLDLLKRYISKYKPNNEFIILSSGALIKRKGMDILIKAVKLIDDRNVRLIIIGEGSERVYLEGLIGNDSRITLHGFQQPHDIPYYFSISDIFAFASRYDGWGVVINEAIAAGKPIISSNKVGASLDIITSGDYGILCESENVHEFKDAILRLMHNENYRKKVIENISQKKYYISSDYNAQKVFDIFTNQI